MALSNRDLSELLARASEDADGNKQKALRRAARRALMWREEVVDLLEADRTLTELDGVGPWVARVIRELADDPPEVPEPDPIRSNFLTFAEVGAILHAHGDWRRELKGDLQMHSLYSDGTTTVAEMASACAARGYSYIAITDHSKGLRIAGGIDETILARQMAEIDSLNAELPHEDFRILKSMEMNLSPTGEGDMDPDALAGLDFVLGSFHSQLRKKDDQTERYLAAVANPDIQVLGHPRGRIFDRRHGLSADWPRVFTYAAELDKAVEIDAYPDRQDLQVDLLMVARDAGVRISIGTDAHAPWELPFIDFGLASAIAAGIPKERIINFKPAEEIVDWARSVRARAAA